MKPGTMHIIGAGLAGLAAAVAMAGAGRQVKLYEAAAQAGGRCRSYFDKELGLVLDNGNHLLLSCNHAAKAFLSQIGAPADALVGSPTPAFPFMDLASQQRWIVKINPGLFPSWIFDATARVPETQWWDYLEGIKLLTAARQQTVAQVLNPNSTLYKRFWHPLTIAILNTQPEEASAALLGRVFGEAFAKGGKGCLPLTAKIGLSESFIHPALAYLHRHGATIDYGCRLREIMVENDTVTALHFANHHITLGAGDKVVLAVPAPVASNLLPDLTAPTAFRAILNAHFRVAGAGDKGGVAITGLLNGTAEWIFEKPHILSTTTSAAETLIDKDNASLAALLWHDVATCYGLNPHQIPPHRIIKEKRATFAATPEQRGRRPSIRPYYKNLILCGDWVDTALPATIEGTLRSGKRAAEWFVS